MKIGMNHGAGGEVMEDLIKDTILGNVTKKAVNDGIGLDSLDDGDYELEESSSQDKNSLTISCLSAGEKQLLSFVAYNIFYSNTIFFIDEPELSLHVDWQNKIFSLLKEQNPTNQFIISTHSPFVYGLFPDKEIIINSDKGCKDF